MAWYDNYEPKDLVGKTLINVIVDYKNNEIELYFDDKTIAKFYHMQDCCESVYIESPEYDVADLKLYIGQTLTDCYRKSTSHTVEYGSETITKLGFCFGGFWFDQKRVEIIWKGESNGYYSEGVDLNITTVK